jgi:hypothetical protein
LLRNDFLLHLEDGKAFVTRLKVKVDGIGVTRPEKLRLLVTVKVRGDARRRVAQSIVVATVSLGSVKGQAQLVLGSTLSVVVRQCWVAKGGTAVLKEVAHHELVHHISVRRVDL